MCRYRVALNRYNRAFTMKLEDKLATLEEFFKAMYGRTLDAALSIELLFAVSLFMDFLESNRQAEAEASLDSDTLKIVPQDVCDEIVLTSVIKPGPYLIVGVGGDVTNMADLACPVCGAKPAFSDVYATFASDGVRVHDACKSCGVHSVLYSVKICQDGKFRHEKLVNGSPLSESNPEDLPL